MPLRKTNTVWQVWGQIHWNVFKYKYLWVYFKYKYFWMYFKYFTNEKNKFIVFPLLFILIHTIHNITASTRFVTSIYEFLLLSTVDRSNKSPEMNVTRASVSCVFRPASMLLYFLRVLTNDVRVGCVHTKLCDSSAKHIK